ncbi:MAG TPA: dockerin type I domain-containing protein [Pirellulales bacterium]|jgi:hypothetical protein
MKAFAILSCIALAALCATSAYGHGFNLSLTFENSGNPTSIVAASQSAYFDDQNVTAAPSNLFLEQFSGTPFSDSSGTYYSVIHGFAQTAGPWPSYTATYNVLSPLYFADGSSVTAATAPAGTYLDVWDRWAGDTVGHPGAALGDVFVNGKTSFYQGYGVSLFDAHELEKDLYIGSGPTNGEYAFAFNITVHFANGITLTTSPLVDVFATSDPNTGAFATNASVAQQDNATAALYRAAMADVNFDGVINAQDLALISSNWLAKGGIGQLPGDANRDGIVNVQDLALISSNWEPGLSLSANVAVPEPTTILLVLSAASVMLARAAMHISRRFGSPARS